MSVGRLQLPQIVLIGLLALAAVPGADAKPKLGPNATPITLANDYLRRAPAPDYWAMAPYYVPQMTTSDCSVATTAIALNALRGLPEENVIPVITGPALLAAMPDDRWRRQTETDGPGVTVADWAGFVRQALDASGLGDAEVTLARPVAANAAALASFRRALADNEASADSVMLVAFNQGVVTGDWDGPHASPIAAYDEAGDRVLILDVDREWYVPYWTDTATLLAAMVKPVGDGFGPLTGDRGAYLLIRRPARAAAP